MTSVSDKDLSEMTSLSDKDSSSAGEMTSVSDKDFAKLMAELERLDQAHSILETALDSDKVSMEHPNFESLQKLLEDIPNKSKQHPHPGSRTEDEEQEEDPLSLTAELSSLQRIIQEKPVFGDRDRDFQKVMEEYEEMERSLADSDDRPFTAASDDRPFTATSDTSYREITATAEGQLLGQKMRLEEGDIREERPLSGTSDTSSSTIGPFSQQSDSGTVRTEGPIKRKLSGPNEQNSPPGASSSSRGKYSEQSAPVTTEIPLKRKQSGQNEQNPPARGSTSSIGIGKPQQSSTRTEGPVKRKLSGQDSPGGGGTSSRGKFTVQSSSRGTEVPVKRKLSGQNVQNSEVGGGDEGPMNSNSSNNNLDEKYMRRIVKLEGEVARQEILIDAFQKDNQDLYNKLRSKESEESKKETEWEELVNSLKTEIATLKISRLVSPSRPTSAASTFHRSEVEKLREESMTKSMQITDLKRELILLRNTTTEKSVVVKPSPMKGKISAQEREKESQKSIRSLTKQVRTLQKILYSKDPSAGQAKGSRDNLSLYFSQDGLNSTKGGGISEDNNPAVNALLEGRIAELERNLESADDEARDRLKEFQARLAGLKTKYEDQVQDYEKQLKEANGRIDKLQKDVSDGALLDLKGRLEKSQAEVGHCKSEITKYKRELEIVQKSSISYSNTVSQVAAKQDAGTLSLAIKSFKSELSDKEKEILRLKKEVGDLNRTTNTLKRERERYLTLTNAQGIPGSVPSSANTTYRVTNKTSNLPPKPPSKPDFGAARSRSPSRGALTTTSSFTTNQQLLQSSLEFERAEFEQIIHQKNMLLEDKERMIRKLSQEVEELRQEMGEDREMDEGRKEFMLNELRTRVCTQNQLIQKLKDHISNYRNLEGDYLRMKQQQQEDKGRIRELKQRLEIAQSLNKPENEILELLSKKFDDLNGRYLQRERQMDSLLSRLAVRTGAHGLSPRASSAYSSGGGLLLASNNNNNTESSSLESIIGKSEDLDLRQLSPSISIHLFHNNNKGDGLLDN